MKKEYIFRGYGAGYCFLADCGVFQKRVSVVLCIVSI